LKYQLSKRQGLADRLAVELEQRALDKQFGEQVEKIAENIQEEIVRQEKHLIETKHNNKLLNG